MKKILVLGSLLMASSIVIATPFKTNEDAINYRQHAYSMMATNFADMGAMIKGKKDWDQSQFEMRANNVLNLSLMTEEGFKDKNSAQGETKAKADIWTDWADFSGKQAMLIKDAKQLAEVSKGTDKGAIKSAFMSVAKDCKSCHKAYRSK